MSTRSKDEMNAQLESMSSSTPRRSKKKRAPKTGLSTDQLLAIMEQTAQLEQLAAKPTAADQSSNASAASSGEGVPSKESIDYAQKRAFESQINDAAPDEEIVIESSFDQTTFDPSKSKLDSVSFEPSASDTPESASFARSLAMLHAPPTQPHVDPWSDKVTSTPGKSKKQKFATKAQQSLDHLPHIDPEVVAQFRTMFAEAMRDDEDPSNAAPSADDAFALSQWEAEQLELVKQVTDYVATYKQPVSDKPQAWQQYMQQLRQLSPDVEIFFATHKRTLRNYNKLLHVAFVHNSYESGMMALHDLMTHPQGHAKGLRPNQYTYTTLLQLCTCNWRDLTPEYKQTRLQKALQIFDQAALAARLPQPREAENLENKDLAIVTSHPHDMQQQNQASKPQSPVTIEVFSSLVSACMKLGSPARAYQCLELMRSDAHKIRPTIHVYTSLLTIYDKHALTTGQLKDVWHDMRRTASVDDAPPDALAYNTYIRALAAHGETEAAINIYEEMLQQSLHPSTITYTNLIRACGRRAEWYGRAMDLYLQCYSSVNTIDMQFMDTVLSVCADHGDVRNAMRVFASCAPDAVGNVAATSGADSAVVETNRSVLKRGKPSYDQTMRALGKSMNVHLLQCGDDERTEARTSQNERLKMLDQLLVQMRDEKIPIDKTTCDLVVYSYSRALRLHRSRELFDEIYKQHQCKPDLLSYTHLLKMYSRSQQLKSALALLDEVKSLSLVPDSNFYRIILVLCRRKHDEEAGTRILAEMRDAGHSVSEFDARLFDPALFAAAVAREKRGWKHALAPEVAYDKITIGVEDNIQMAKIGASDLMMKHVDARQPKREFDAKLAIVDKQKNAVGIGQPGNTQHLSPKKWRPNKMYRRRLEKEAQQKLSKWEPKSLRRHEMRTPEQRAKDASVISKLNNKISNESNSRRGRPNDEEQNDDDDIVTFGESSGEQEELLARVQAPIKPKPRKKRY